MHWLVVGWKRCFESGRASRPEFWGFIGSYIIILIVAGILDVDFETEEVTARYCL